MTIRNEKGNEMKMVMVTNRAVGYSFDEVVEREVDGYQFWSAAEGLEDLAADNFFEDGNYYYFSNYYGSDGGYYNPEDGATFYTSSELDCMDEDMVEDIQNNWNFVEEPCIKEIYNLRAGFESEREYQFYGEKRIIGCGEEVIRDEDGHLYRYGGIYQFIGDKFYPVELMEEKIYA